MLERTQFYQERDRRTVEYGVQDIFDSPVGIVVSERAARTVVGQRICLALVNLCARIHRSIHLAVPKVRLLVEETLVCASHLDEAAERLARAIDPFIQISPSLCGTSIGIGDDAPGGLACYVGAQGWIGSLDVRPTPSATSDDHSLGADLAACLGAAALTQLLLGRPIRPARISLWNCLGGDAASDGPLITGPLNVGDVELIGAGGVGSCFCYWASRVGTRGRWRVVDADLAELHNTNRCLGLLPVDCGSSATTAVSKAVAAARLIHAEPILDWYNASTSDSFAPDLVIPIANERNVRYAVSMRGEPIIVHATTSRDWEAQFHRHIPGRDDCIVCRMPTAKNKPTFACSNVEVATGNSKSTDAALPFLSAGAGLLLLAGLLRLEYGQLADDDYNLFAIRFNNPRSWTRQAIHTCREHCSNVIAAPARRLLRAKRWTRLDHAAI